MSLPSLVPVQAGVAEVSKESEELQQLAERAIRAGIHRTVNGHEVKTTECRELEQRLWKYGFAVLQKMLKNGEINERRVAMGESPVRMAEWQAQRVFTSMEARQTLAVDMITVSMTAFIRTVVERQKWQPARSSLGTYFINICIMNFRGVYRRWSRQQREWFSELRDQAWWDARGLSTALTATRSIFVEAEAIREAFAEAPTHVQLILRRIYQGWTHSEISAELGISAKAVESRMARFRRTTGKRIARSHGLGPTAAGDAA